TAGTPVLDRGPGYRICLEKAGPRALHHRARYSLILRRMRRAYPRRTAKVATLTPTPKPKRKRGFLTRFLVSSGQARSLRTHQSHNRNRRLKQARKEQAMSRTTLFAVVLAAVAVATLAIPSSAHQPPPTNNGKSGPNYGSVQ